MLLSRRQAVLFGASLAFVGRARPVQAHRLITTDTRVDIDTETGKIEVIHSFHVHDTETTLLKASIIDGPDLLSLRSRAQLALYTEQHFSLKNGQTPIELKILGAELDKRNILVFQEGQLKKELEYLLVEASMMRELVVNQINNVDIAIDGKITSVQFRGRDLSKKVLA